MTDAYTRLLATGFEQPKRAVASVKRVAGQNEAHPAWVPLQIEYKRAEADLVLSA